MPLVRIDSIEALEAHAVTARTVGILPVAATEAHGPHLPPSTDCDIAEGHLGLLAKRLGRRFDVAVLPTQRIGASLEHCRFEATHSRHTTELVEDWYGLVRAFATLGGRRLIIVSSHGGNTAAVDTVILMARAALGMLAVGTAWMRFGYPAGLFSEHERQFGIHGGDIETSLMLHYAPHAVDMDKAQDFVSRLETLLPEMRYLSAYGPHRFGWLSDDLNPYGVVGNAAAATARKGERMSLHVVRGFAALVRDVSRFDLKWLARAEGPR